jgi:hypothetical protein
MIKSNESSSRGFYIGLAIGQLWLSLVSTAFVAVLWVLGQNVLQISLILAGVVLIGVCLLGTSIVLLRKARQLPNDTLPASAARSREIGRRMGKRFGLVVLAEIVIIAVVNVILAQSGHGEWIVPATYFIVGVHFIPLAFVFRVKPYVLLSILWIIVTLFTVLFTSAEATLGQGLGAWVLFPLAGCGLATWIITAYILSANLTRVRATLNVSPTA